MFHFNDGWKLEDFEDYTVIIPSICIMSAGQLAMDVLIASKKMRRIGQISHIALVPMFGVSAFLHCPEERTASCEIYAIPEEKLIAIQFRTIMVHKYAGPFLKKVAKLLKDARVRRVIVLSNALQFQQDCLFQYLSTEAFKVAHKADFKNVNWQETEDKDLLGGGTDILLLKAFEQQEVPAMIYYRYISKPMEAVKEQKVHQQISELLVDFLKIGEKFELILPLAWHSMLGNDNCESMF